MAKKITKFVVELKERPSFEGELNIRLTAERDSHGNVNYALICQKNPPLDGEPVGHLSGISDREFERISSAICWQRELSSAEVGEITAPLDDEMPVGRLSGISDRELEQISSAICWQRELSSAEVGEITALLQHEVVSIFPEPLCGLDGTRYELLIEAGIDRVQFSWWEEGPSGWKPLRDLSMMLLRIADAPRMIEMLQSSERKELIKRLRQRADEEQLRRVEAERMLVSESNSRARELARRAEIMGITCPTCKQHSRDVRFIDRAADAKAYFICRRCGRSFTAENV